MFKIHTTEAYGKPEFVDGWITDFFPWSKTGERLPNDYFKKTAFRHAVKNLCPQTVSVDVFYRTTDAAGAALSDQPLHFTAGFLGILELTKDHTLEPQIGWLISENSKPLKDSLTGREFYALVYHNLEVFPNDILSLEGHREIHLNFSGQITIPKELAALKIGDLKLTGKVSHNEWNNIRDHFAEKDTYVTINNRSVKRVPWEDFISDMKQLSSYRKWYTEY